jgi:hypothetical protein
MPVAPASQPTTSQGPATPTGAPSLHEHAVAAERHLEQLATGLTQAGASDQVVKTFTQMAEVTRKLVVALGRGQEQTGDAEAPADQAVAPPPPTQPRTIQSASQELHDNMRPQRGA